MTGPVTLGDLAREAKLLWVYCCDCAQPRNLKIAALAIRRFRLRLLRPFQLRAPGPYRR